MRCCTRLRWVDESKSKEGGKNEAIARQEAIETTATATDKKWAEKQKQNGATGLREGAEERYSVHSPEEICDSQRASQVISDARACAIAAAADQRIPRFAQQRTRHVP
ncbi:hypothetical protein EW146_g5905 [Bondarzewia mesenterica]|uniref:Uncharacterized protein n=1 Tax=Bondarzewia mesenterica TaxID=1095465 RepID=A0A4S4LQ18_9AGAM|nr:hypothetical protein EW146_g5905 [Bondarzewia mesenterica]